MIKWTTGKEYFTDFTLKIAINHEENFNNQSSNLYFRLILLEEGTINITINGINNTLVSPCILCLNNKDIALISDQTSYKAESICFHPSAVNYYFDLENIYDVPEDSRITEAIYQDKNFLTAFLEKNKLYNGIIEVDANVMEKTKILSNKIELELASQYDQFWPCRTRSYFIEILITLEMCFHNIISGDKSIQKSNNEINAENILEYIQINYSKRIVLDDLSRKFNINRTTLNQRFLELTGNTVITYLIKHRLMIANALLKNTSLPIQEISERSGFNDITNFSRAFKKQYGMSPSHFRKYINFECSTS